MPDLSSVVCNTVEFFLNVLLRGKDVPDLSSVVCNTVEFFLNVLLCGERVHTCARSKLNGM